VTAAAVMVLPLVLLMVTVMLLAVASLVIPAHRQRHLLAVLDRLVKIATALRGSSK
jgi:cell division protein FtsL